MGKTGLIYSDRYLDHDTGGHVENVDRVKAIRSEILDRPWADAVEWIAPRAATVDEVGMNHARDYIDFIKSACGRVKDIAYLNPDTAVCSESYEVALLAAGGVMEGIDRLIDERLEGFFAMVRPPGHHAEYDESLGFCLFNNIAIGARYAIENHGLKRVFIFDWDVHHGNGTQHSFEAEPAVFFCSLHQYPHYPGTGGKSEFGREGGQGYTLNFPMQSGSGDDDYLYLVEEFVVPAIKKFNPELLLISAGFDAHRNDSLSGIMLSEECYGSIAGGLMEAVSADCRIGCVLEGGYDLDALATSVAKVVGVIAGEESTVSISESKSPSIAAMQLAEYIKSEHPFFK